VSDYVNYNNCSLILTPVALYFPAAVCSNGLADGKYVADGVSMRVIATRLKWFLLSSMFLFSDSDLLVLLLFLMLLSDD
jgi:hypothetical protein